MLIFKAPGDFCNFQRTRDRGPKKVEKRHPEDPPKTHSKMETEIQETPRRLYISYFGTPCRARKSISKIRADRKTAKTQTPERRPDVQKKSAQAEIAKPCDFQWFRSFWAERTRPRAASADGRGGPPRANRKTRSQNGLSRHSAP